MDCFVAFFFKDYFTRHCGFILLLSIGTIQRLEVDVIEGKGGRERGRERRGGEGRKCLPPQ
jgi:hypothetical protein